MLSTPTKTRTRYRSHCSVSPKTRTLHCLRPDCMNARAPLKAYVCFRRTPLLSERSGSVQPSVHYRARRTTIYWTALDSRSCRVSPRHRVGGIGGCTRHVCDLYIWRPALEGCLELYLCIRSRTRSCRSMAKIDIADGWFWRAVVTIEMRVRGHAAAAANPETSAVCERSDTSRVKPLICRPEPLEQT